MLAYIQFIIGCLFWQILFYGIINFLTKVVSFIFALVNIWLVSIPLALSSCLCSLLYATFVYVGNNTYGLNAVILYLVFALELLAMAMLNTKPENEEGLKVSLLVFIAKLLVIPMFIIVGLTKLNFGYKAIQLYLHFANWILEIPVIGSVIEFIINMRSSKIVLGLFIILLIIIVLLIIWGFKRLFGGNLKKGYPHNDIFDMTDRNKTSNTHNSDCILSNNAHRSTPSDADDELPF